MRLYAETETKFDHNGLGALPDAVSCIVTEERNGAFELELQYPATGLHFAELKTGRLLCTLPNPIDDEQPFRIYRISKPLGGVVTVNAAHISYDLSGVPLSPFTAGSAAEAFAKLPQQAATPCPFTFSTDKATAGSFSVRVPQAIRAVMGGQEGSLLDVYGGEYRYDRFRVSLLNARGQNNGVSIRYGKNLTDLQQEENIAGVYTGAYPFWASQESYCELPEKLVSAEGTYSFTRVLPLDFSGEFTEKPTAEQLRDRAKRYLKENRVGIPTVSLQVSFVPLEQTVEYKQLALLERVCLCDTVTVQFEEMGVNATAKCVKTVYDVLKQRYTSVELGDAKTNIADTLAQQQKELAKAPTFTAMQSAIDAATKLITGNSGGFVVLHSSTGGSAPDEILIMDTADIATAKKVWRWNKAGLGYSSNGYNGPFGLAMTANGQIVADFITAGTLNANLIKAGIISSKDGKSQINLDSGIAALTGSAFFDSLQVGAIGGRYTGRFFADADGMPQFAFSDKAGRPLLSLSPVKWGNGTFSMQFVMFGGGKPVFQLRTFEDGRGVFSMFGDNKVIASINQNNAGGDVTVYPASGTGFAMIGADSQGGYLNLNGNVMRNIP